MKDYSMKQSLQGQANWDSLWNQDFKYGILDSWAREIFITIAELLRDIENPRILSAGCGRGLIDYWLVKVFGYQVIFLDYSNQCIANLEKSLSELDKNKYSLCHASIHNLPFPNNSFDLVWNEGVLEHFTEQEYYLALREMKRVSKKYILVDVPNAACKPYMLSKHWLEENGMWPWGYEKPRVSLKNDFEMLGMKILCEKTIGNRTTILNYINMVPADQRGVIFDQLGETDYNIFPHLLTFGEIVSTTSEPIGSIDKKRAELEYWINLSRELTKDCITDAKKKEALLRVCYEKAFPRYKESLYLADDSFIEKKILDVGCGPHCGIIGFKQCEKYGLDHLINDYIRIGYPLLEHGVNYSNGKAEGMPFDSDFFDVVICVNALDHVDNLKNSIREISRVLKIGGQFIGQFNFHIHPTETEPICLVHETLVTLCAENGLSLNKSVFQYRMAEMQEDRYYYEFIKNTGT